MECELETNKKSKISICRLDADFRYVTVTVLVICISHVEMIGKWVENKGCVVI